MEPIKTERRAHETKASIGVLLGFLIPAFTIVITAVATEERFTRTSQFSMIVVAGCAVSLGCFIFAGVHISKAKGHSPWWGLAAVFPPGLVCLYVRRDRLPTMPCEMPSPGVQSSSQPSRVLSYQRHELPSPAINPAISTTWESHFVRSSTTIGGIVIACFGIMLVIVILATGAAAKAANVSPLRLYFMPTLFFLGGSALIALSAVRIRNFFRYAKAVKATITHVGSNASGGPIWITFSYLAAGQPFSAQLYIPRTDALKMADGQTVTLVIDGHNPRRCIYDQYAVPFVLPVA